MLDDSPPARPVTWHCIAQDPVTKDWCVCQVVAQTAFTARQLASAVFGFVPDWTGVKRGDQ